MALNEKQKRFCLEYLKCMNATEAARKAGYGAPKSQGSRLLTYAGVQQELKTQFVKKNSNLNQDVKAILQELRRLAFSDITNYLEFHRSGVDLKDSKDLKPEHTRAISEVSQSHTQFGTNIKFKLYDKPKAIELLGRYHKMFVEQVEHTGKDGGPIDLTAPLNDAEKTELDRLRAKLGQNKKR